MVIGGAASAGPVCSRTAAMNKPTAERLVWLCMLMLHFGLNPKIGDILQLN
jgi:hypothetical protein